MSFEEEWAELKAVHAPSGSVGMQIDGAGKGPGGGRDKPLVVTPSVLRTRAGRAETVRGQFLKADDEVMRETGQVDGTLKGFATQAALKTFQERWRGQMAYVKGQFGSTAGALRYAADHFRSTDVERGMATRDAAGDTSS
ncbi:hypothetical protein GCM10009801_02800 [Streptomyces albiaxialis]|uniref:ESX-1 secretion-associated protein n=1 Tax=Streptomyces albiaxialis TaxID=329523 RepID=A0ABN2VF92_9ACTN